MGLLEVAALSAAPAPEVRGSVELVALAGGEGARCIRATRLSTVCTGGRVVTPGLP